MYTPKPIDTSDVVLGQDIIELSEALAENTHEVWSKNRINDGWTYGERRDDEKRQHPCLIPYDELPEEEKEYDRHTSLETLKLIIKLGYKIVKREE
jgi:ryanodine receptor 2